MVFTTAVNSHISFRNRDKCKPFEQRTDKGDIQPLFVSHKDREFIVRVLLLNVCNIWNVVTKFVVTMNLQVMSYRPSPICLV